ncbi:uncharacterized protein [Oscarella lobularis]|uniref:uncharacterized protein n=1 Tax=Oscarella lobularis TaxID=121494 RepID=UPI00331395BD
MTPLVLVLAFAAVLFSPAQSDDAIQDKACNQQYHPDCAKAYLSGSPADCTSQCNASLSDDIVSQPVCSTGQRNLIKACFGKSVQATSCGHFGADCNGNSACAAASLGYLANCGHVLASGRPADCTNACRLSYNALLAIEPGFRSCSCDGEPLCETARKNIQAGCFTEEDGSTAMCGVERMTAIATIIVTFLFAYWLGSRRRPAN